VVNVDGSIKGALSTDVEDPMGLLHLPKFDHVAVASQSGAGSIIFFDLEDYREQGTLSVDDTAASLPMFSGVVDPRLMAAGEYDNEFLFTTSNEVVRACVPLPNSECVSSRRDDILVRGGSQFWGVGALLSKGSLIVVDRQNIGTGIVYECSLRATEQDLSQCTIFADKPENIEWDPMALLVDENKQMMYIGDNQYAVVHLFSFDGSYGGHVEENKGFLLSPSSMAMKPGPFATISPVTFPSAAAIAGVPIITPIVLRTHLNQALDSSYPIVNELYRFKISASGFIPGTEFVTSIEGYIHYDSNAEAHESLLGNITIPYKGEWVITITEGLLNPQNLFGSPFEISVDSGPTDPNSCASQLMSTNNVEAGSNFSVSIWPRDAFLNPTAHDHDSFYGILNGGDKVTQLVRTDSEFTHSEKIKEAGKYFFSIFHASTGSGSEIAGTEIANSPFHFEVIPASPNAGKTTHNKPNKKIDSSSESSLTLQVYPMDFYLNPITFASGYKVNVAGHSSDVDGDYELASTVGYATTLTIPKGLEATIIVTFILNNDTIGDGNPLSIIVAPPPSQIMLIVGIVAAVVLVAGIVFYVFYSRTQKLEREMQQIGHQKSALERQRHELSQQNIHLQEDLRKKKHSDDELEVMKKALEELSQARSDELKECLIDSKEVKVDRLLGKGGFGVVNLATYKGQFVAQKQLLTINDESVKRFRFECFLLKSLRHPNIVKLIGVCWDDDLFACCLEFVENGSLEDWLKKARGNHHGDICWRTHLLKTAQECALGVEYLHQERYWAEEEVDEEGIKIDAGWRECIIHRDLKPDNMLLTNDWTLKLTDFGEARAVQLNQTMTSVGTPIYVAPEVMKGYRYDATADSYSFGICLVAMIRGEKNIMDYYFEALRKTMKKKNRGGVGITILNQRMYSRGWRPLLPMTFEKGYPKLCALIKECWGGIKEKRPVFKDIVRRLNSEISEEINRHEEPVIVYLHKQDDELYWEQMELESQGGVVNDGDEEHEDGEDERGNTEKFVSRKFHEECMKEKDRMLEELKKTIVSIE
jgi:serine/threonine protein kinase